MLQYKYYFMYFQGFPGNQVRYLHLLLIIYTSKGRLTCLIVLQDNVTLSCAITCNEILLINNRKYILFKDFLFSFPSKHEGCPV